MSIISESKLVRNTLPAWLEEDMRIARSGKKPGGKQHFSIALVCATLHLHTWANTHNVLRYNSSHLPTWATLQWKCGEATHKIEAHACTQDYSTCTNNRLQHMHTHKCVAIALHAHKIVEPKRTLDCSTCMHTRLQRMRAHGRHLTIDMCQNARPNSHITSANF